MLLWLVESRRPVLKNRCNDYVMDSAYNYLNHPPLKPYISFQLLTDSGAYTAARKGIELDPYTIIEIQEKLGSNIAVPLDYPFMPGMSIKEMKKRWERTIENTRLWSEILNPSIELLPVIHAIGKKHLTETVRIVSKVSGNAEIMAIGTIVDQSLSLNGFLGDRQPKRELMEMIIQAIKIIKSYGYKVHITGFGSSPLTLHLAIYLGVDSTDSSGYRRKAAYGKIILPEQGERYVGNGKANFGIAHLSPSEKKKLQECKCPICRNDPSLLWRDWRARAIHNEWVIKQTWKKGLKLKESGIEEYEKYLDRLYENSSLRYLWRYVKTIVKYNSIYE